MFVYGRAGFGWSVHQIIHWITGDSVDAHTYYPERGHKLTTHLDFSDPDIESRALDAHNTLTPNVSADRLVVSQPRWPSPNAPHLLPLQTPLAAR